MNVFIDIGNLSIDGAGNLIVSFTVVTSTGVQVGADVAVAFTQTNTQMLSAFITRAKAVLAEAGVTVPGNANVKVFGGPS